MGKTSRKFSLEFKQQVLAEIASGQKSLSQAAGEYQISVAVINRWPQQAEEIGHRRRTKERCLTQMR